MGQEIDSLEVKIAANARSANTQLSNLVGRLNAVSSSINSINGNGLNGLASGIQRLGTAMKSLDGVRTSDFSRLSNNIMKIGNINTANINTAASSIGRLSTVFSRLNSAPISDSAVRMGELAKSISSLGYKSATQAITNIPKLATGMSSLMATLSKAPLVSQNLIDMTNALANLSRTGASSGRAADSLSRSLFNYSNSASVARKSSFSLASAIGKVYASYWLLFRAFGKLKKGVDLASGLTEVQNIVDVTFGKNYTGMIDKMVKTSIQDFGMSELTVKQVASRFQAMGTAMGFSQGKMANMSVELTKLTADMASFYNVEQADVAEDLQSIFTGQTRPLRTYGLDLTQATLQEWAMKNGLDANIKSMSQAEKTMLRYQYVIANTKSSAGDFVRTQNTWANQTRILKQNIEQLGIVVGKTFINLLKPLVTALNSAMTSIIGFVTNIFNALGQIFGWKMTVDMSGVTSDMDDFGDSADDASDGLGSAADNAKKLKKSLMSFDELNVLNQDDTSSSGGSGSGGSSSGSGEIGEPVYNFERTESAIKSEIDNMFDLGQYVRNAICNALESINWDEMYQKAENVGRGFAQFLNGLFSPDENGIYILGKDIGEFLAGALNTGLHLFYGFADELNWHDVGMTIAAAINGFFDKFDFKLLAKTINKWVQGIWEMISTAFKNTDKKKILKGLTDFISNIDIETVEILIGAFALRFAGKILTSSILRSFIMGELSKLFTAAFGTGAVGLANASAAAFVVTATIFVTLEFAKDAKEWFDNIERWGWDTGRKITASNNPANPYNNGNAISDEDLEAIRAWQKSNNEKREQNKQDSYQYIEDEIKRCNELNDKFEEYVRNWQKENRLARDTQKKELYTWCDEVGEKFKSWYENDVSPWFTKERWQELGNNIKVGISTKWNEFSSWWKSTGIYNWYQNNVMPWFTIERWNSLGENIKTGISNKWNEFTDWWRNTGIYTWWNNNVAPWFTVSKWFLLANGIKEGITNKWTEFKNNWITNITSWWNSNVAPWFTTAKWSALANGIKEGITNKWNEFTTWWNNTGFKQWWDGVVQKFDKKNWTFSGIKDGLSQAFNNAIDAIKQIWNKFANWMNEKLKFKWDDIVVGGVKIADGGSIQIGKLPTFQTGGFPEDGLFMANHNELVGQFSNGKTAVANNDQIIEGISYGVSNANERVVEAINSLISVVRDIDTNASINIDGRELASAISARSSRNGLSFT